MHANELELGEASRKLACACRSAQCSRAECAAGGGDVLEAHAPVHVLEAELLAGGDEP